MDRQKLMAKGVWKLTLKDDEDLSKLTIKVRERQAAHAGRTTWLEKG